MNIRADGNVSIALIEAYEVEKWMPVRRPREMVPTNLASAIVGRDIFEIVVDQARSQ